MTWSITLTDISNWESTIHKRLSDKPTKEELGKFFVSDGQTEYCMIPMDMSGYQLGNLLWLLRKHPEDNSGDWYYEIISIIQEACIKLGISGVYSNLEGNEEFKKDIQWIKDKIQERKTVD